MDQKQQSAIIKKYRNLPEKQLFILEGDRYVIGEEVDAENRLWYVVRKNMKYTVELALVQQIKHSFFKPRVYTKSYVMKFTLAELTNNKPVQ